MSGRDLFVVLSRLVGAILLLEAVPAAGFLASRWRFDWDITVMLAAWPCVGVLLLLGAPRMAGVFTWSEVAPASGASIGRSDWLRIVERSVGLLALVRLATPVSHVIVYVSRQGRFAAFVDDGIRREIIELALLGVAAVWLLRRSGRGVVSEAS